jgi:ATP-dependent DNA helicase RecQ
MPLCGRVALSHNTLASYSDLAAYRLSEARAQQMPPYCIMHNSVLQKIASIRPTTLEQLVAVPGMGPIKVQKYGAAILDIIREHSCS